MTERVYITLKEASEHLQAKGLTGQTVTVLRSAIAGRRLQALKDGSRWMTTVEKLDAYERVLWRGSAQHVAATQHARWSHVRPHPTPKPAEKPAPTKRGRPAKSPTRPPKPKRVKKPTQEEKEVAEFLARPAEEKKQRWRDYLDGKREHWRY